MKYWAVQHEDGSTSYHITTGVDPTAEGIDTGERIANTGRAPGAGERWDWDAGDWCHCPVLGATVAASTAENIKVVIHARKALEAWEYHAKGGVGGSWPMLAAEALALDIDLADLVATVLAHDQRLIDAEVARRTIKTAPTP